MHNCTYKNCKNVGMFVSEHSRNYWYCSEHEYFTSDPLKINLQSDNYIEISEILIGIEWRKMRISNLKKKVIESAIKNTVDHKIRSLSNLGRYLGNISKELISKQTIAIKSDNIFGIITEVDDKFHDLFRSTIKLTQENQESISIRPRIKSVWYKYRVFLIFNLLISWILDVLARILNVIIYIFFYIFSSFGFYVLFSTVPKDKCPAFFMFLWFLLYWYSSSWIKNLFNPYFVDQNLKYLIGNMTSSMITMIISSFFTEVIFFLLLI